MQQLKVQQLSVVETFQLQNVQTQAETGQYYMQCSRFSAVEHLSMVICSRNMLC
jgi:heme/copper-type cytochrome/quinol oxidase subunit 2